MRHISRRIQRAATLGLAVAAVGVSACAAPLSAPAGLNTARITIDGQNPATYPILCTQRGWLWTIETLPDTPGFSAMLQTGAAVTPQIMRINDLQGFTGNSTDEAMEASIDGSTFTLTGTLGGAFADRPTKPASVEYRVQAHC